MATAPKPQPVPSAEEAHVDKMKPEPVPPDETADPSGSAQSGVDTPITK